MRELYNAWEENNQNDDDDILGIKFRCDANFYTENRSLFNLIKNIILSYIMPLI